MDEDRNKIWIENILERCRLPIPAVSLAFGLIFLSVFIFFDRMLITFNYDLPNIEFLSPDCVCCDYSGIECVNQYYQLICSSMAVLVVTFAMIISVSVEFIMLQKLLKALNEIFWNQRFGPGDESTLNRWRGEYNARFANSHWYYVVIAAIILQVFLASIIYYLQNGSSIFFYFLEPEVEKYYEINNTWGGFLGIAFDIFIRAIDLAIFYLLAHVLWTIINISWSIDELAGERYRDTLWVNTVNPDNITGLSQIKNLVLKGFTYYSVCISLAIFSDPILFTNGSLINNHSQYNDVGLQITSLITYQNISLIILFLIGLAYSLNSTATLEGLKRYRLVAEINRINEKYRLNYEKLIEVSSKLNSNDGAGEYANLPTILKTLQEEKTRILSVNRSKFDLKASGAFLSSLLLPIFSTIFSKYLQVIISNILNIK
jgi:hypothetical protein